MECNDKYYKSSKRDQTRSNGIKQVCEGFKSNKFYKQTENVREEIFFQIKPKRWRTLIVVKLYCTPHTRGEDILEQLSRTRVFTGFENAALFPC